jgi:stage II sporulation protein E
VRADCKSLPLGILRGVGFDKAASKLGVGDIVLMVSDGAVADGTEWISAMLRDFEGTAEGLCRQIATEANRRRCDGHTDDITVSAAIIERSCS